MAVIALNLIPFRVPDFVLIETPPRGPLNVNPPPSVPLNALPQETLEQLCKQFRDSVMEKAGYQKPNTMLTAWVEQEIARHKP